MPRTGTCAACGKPIMPRWRQDGEARCRACYTKERDERSAAARATGKQSPRVRSYLHARAGRPSMEIAPGEFWTMEGDCPKCHEPVIWQSSLHYTCATGRERTILRGSERRE